MTKKRLYIIIAITAIVTIGFFIAAYIISQQGGGESTDTPKNPFANFFPFGKGTPGTGSSDGGPISGSGNTNGSENIPLVNPKSIPALRQISSTATAGYYPSARSGKPAVVFVERATGNIFETVMEDMQRNRISNALLPRAEEVFFGEGGKYVVYRYIKEGGSSVVTFVRNVPAPDKLKVEASDATTTNPISGSFLPEDILNVFVSPDTKNMLYFTKTPEFNTRVALGNIFNFQKNTSARVFQSPFSEWLPVYFDGKTALLQTKASQNVPGYLYSVSMPNGELKKIIGGVNGLTALPSPDLTKVLYSESTRGGVVLHMYNRKEKTTLDILLSTLPEKCVWTVDSATLYCAAPDYLPGAEYPDAWYQGSVSFNDAMWKIDAKTGTMTALFTPESFSAPKMDMENLMLSPNKDFLFFINKNDSTLWGYSLRSQS